MWKGSSQHLSEIPVMACFKVWKEPVGSVSGKPNLYGVLLYD